MASVQIALNIECDEDHLDSVLDILFDNADAVRNHLSGVMDPGATVRVEDSLGGFEKF